MVKAGDGRGAFQKWITDAVTKGKDPINSQEDDTHGLGSRDRLRREVQRARTNSPPSSASNGRSIATMQKPGNLHRVIIFKDGGDKAGQVLPFSAADSIDPEKLWEYLASLRGEDRRNRSRHRPQRQCLQRADVPARAAERPADRPGVRRDAHALGTAVRGDPDEGRRRGASIPVSQRRVRRLRHMGQGRHCRPQAQRGLDAPVRVCAQRPAGGSPTGSRSSASTPTSSA